MNPTLFSTTWAWGLKTSALSLAAANARIARKGQLETASRTFTLSTTDQLLQAKRLPFPPCLHFVTAALQSTPSPDVATVTDSVEDNLRTAGDSLQRPAFDFAHRFPSQTGANIIDTVDRINALLPQFQAEIPAGIHLNVAMDRTTTIRASVHDVEMTIIIGVILVILVGVPLPARHSNHVHSQASPVPVSLVTARSG